VTATILKPLPKVARGRTPLTDGHRRLTSTERLALFVCCFKRGDSLHLFDGLSESLRHEARAFARTCAQWDSPTRQGRLTQELGLSPDARARVDALILESAPALRRAIAECLPPSFRDEYPHLLRPEVPKSPALLALARRLVREAIR
jgi:hypothetical protein